MIFMEQKFQKIKEIVEKELSCSAHSMDHVMRVYNLCLHLTENEDIDLNILKAAALLHDIARVKEDNDPSGKIDHAILSAEMAIPILQKSGFSEKEIKDIQHCIISHRYRTGNKPKTKEAKILFDADKLDGLGAIGIIRTFVWANTHNAENYTKSKFLLSYNNIEEYVKDNLGGKINGRLREKAKHGPYLEFETKLKFVINKLYTKKAKVIAKERTRFLKDFLERLDKEIKGEL